MDDVINLLNMHHRFFFYAKKYADLTKQAIYPMVQM